LSYFNLSGQRFGRLWVVRRNGSSSGHATWLCVCDCGASATVRGNSLRRGSVVSCGCVAKINREKVKYLNKLPDGEAAFRKLLRSYRRSAKKRGIEFRLTPSIFKTLTSLPCHYCGAIPEQEKKTGSSTGSYFYNGIDRLDSSGHYELTNVVPCCKCCNMAKATMEESEFLTHIKKIYEHRVKGENDEFE